MKVTKKVSLGTDPNQSALDRFIEEVLGEPLSVDHRSTIHSYVDNIAQEAFALGLGEGRDGYS